MMAQRDDDGSAAHVDRFRNGYRAAPEAPRPTLSPVVLIIITALVSALVGLGVAGLTRLAETSVSHDGALREMQAERRAIADRLGELLVEMRRLTERVDVVRDEQSVLDGRVTGLELRTDEYRRRIEILEQPKGSKK